MTSTIRKYLSETKGAIAVETAIVTPVMLAILLPSIDIGYRVHTMQKLNQATDSGIEYVVKGGRDEPTLRNIVQDAFGISISTSDLQINAYCGCIVSSNNNDGQSGTNDPHEGFYVKTQTSLAEDMCPALCDDGEAASELVELALSHMVKGTVTEKQVIARLQTRLK